MRILLDEMLDRRLGRHLTHEVQTVRERGWGSTKDGKLLELAQEEFDVLLTADKNLPYQQNLSRFDLAVVVLSGSSNRYEELAALMDEVSIDQALAAAPHGKATFVGPGRRMN